MERGLADLSLENGEEAFPASDEVELVVHFPAMRNTMKNVWHPLEGVQISDLGAPWTFNTHLLIIHRIQENEDPMTNPLMYFRPEMELGWDLSLRAQSRKATIVNNIWLRGKGRIICLERIVMGGNLACLFLFLTPDLATFRLLCTTLSLAKAALVRWEEADERREGLS
ncbi:hypothetical protein Gohar_011336 [Gossypium harknessii]|uniref:Uncharacterized protein n=1 Tax=Gossypium harknessii TaxID=34285 RepID=A0A7J9GTM5_9ROSI|nr:hypothetical protein [Gossypium harknessii]